MKLAVIVAVAVPGIVAEVLTLRAAGASRGAHPVMIGRRYALSVTGSVFVGCNDPGCGTTGHDAPLDGLDLEADLVFEPRDVETPRRYSLAVRTGHNHQFVSPLTGKITLADATLSEAAKADIRRAANEKGCGSPVIKNVRATGLEVVPQ